MTTITFGKHSGKTTNQLKSIDPEYLRWGAQNLRSDYWREEFAKAVATITEMDEARALTRDGDIDLDDALNYVRETNEIEAENERQYEACKAAEDAVLAKWAEFMEHSVEKMRGIRRRFEADWEEVTYCGFSSYGAYENFRAMMAECDACWRGLTRQFTGEEDKRYVGRIR